MAAEGKKETAELIVQVDQEEAQAKDAFQSLLLSPLSLCCVLLVTLALGPWVHVWLFCIGGRTAKSK